MGQKVNPIGLRLGITRTWKSLWCDDKKDSYVTKLHQDIALRKYVKKELYYASVADIIIIRKVDIVSLNVQVARPGAVVGKRGGADIDRVKKACAKIIDGGNIEINISEVKRPEANAVLMTEGIAHQLVKRVAFRRSMRRAMQGCMRAGAKGVKVRCSGRLGGAEIARTEWYKEGRVPLHTFRAHVDYGFSESKTTYGIIGVKAWVYWGDVNSSNYAE